MKLQVSQSDFSSILNITSRFVSNRATLPVLANVVMEADNNKLTLMATNLEASICKSIGAKVTEAGKISVNAKVFFDIVSNLSSSTLTLESEKEGVKITDEGFAAKVSGLNPSDFPNVPMELGDKDKLVTLPWNVFLTTLNKVVFSASRDETRPVLTGVLFIFDTEGLTLVSSDGFRLSKKFITQKLDIKEQKLVIVPKTVLSEMSKLNITDTSELAIGFREEENQIVFEVGDTVIASRVIDGKFPDFEKIIPKNLATKVFVDKETFAKSLKISSVFARDSANIIKINVLSDSLEILSQSVMSGEQKSKIEARVVGPELKISFNYRFLEEFLGICEADEVELDVNDSSSPGIFKDSKDPKLLHLIMTVKL